jgi:DNA-binding MarR family transcriptional regulator
MSNANTNNISDADFVAVKKLERALRQVRAAIDPLVPTQVVQAFLAVATNEGKTLSELSEILGTNLSTASRQLLDLGDRNRKMEQGYMLIDRKSDPMNLRINRYTLTPKGKLLFKELATIMRD